MNTLFNQRSQQPEWMDTAVVTFHEFDECLAHLERINRCTRAYAPTLHWLQKIWARKDTDTFTLWDVGSGGGDMLRRIWHAYPGDKTHLQLTGIDMNPWSKQSAEARTPADMAITFETDNIFNIHDHRHADCIISALFTHHLTNAELIRFIQWMEKHSTHGWFINDLHRHPLAYYFIKPVTRLFNLNRMVQHDAPVSVLRAFTRQDWQHILTQAGIPLDAIEITWHWPFRYGISRCKP